MESRLRTILSKIREQGEATGLGADELAYLAELVDGPSTADPDAPKPVWWFLRRQALLFRGVFQLDAHRWISGIEHVLADAGAPPGQRNKPSAHFVQKVTLADLHDAVRRNLASPETDRRTAAATLVGLAELGDLAPLLVDALDSGREARASYGHPVIAGMIESLVRLGHPRAAEFAIANLTSSDYSIKQVVVPAALACADQVSDADLGRLLRGEFQTELAKPFAAVFARAARAGVLDPDTLRRVVTENSWDAGRCLASAEILLDGGQHDLAVELIEQNEGNLVAALALRVLAPAGGAADPAAGRIVEALRSQFDSFYGTTKSAAALALATHAEDVGSLLTGYLDAGDDESALGAVWGALGRSDLPRAVEEALVRQSERTDNQTLRRAAGFVLAHRRGGGDPQLAEIHWQKLLEEDDWWPWQLGVDAARAARIEVPPVVDLFHGISTRPPYGDRARLDRLMEAHAAQPWHLVRWLDRKDTSSDQRQIAVHYAALVGTPLMRSAVEHALLASTEQWTEEDQVLVLSVLGGPTTRVAELRGRFLLAEYNEELRLPADDLQPALAAALRCDGEVARAAIRSLASFGGKVEEELALLLGAEDTNIADAAAQAAAKLREPRIALTADIGKLLGGRVTAVRELATAAQLVRLRAPVVRLALVELCGRPDNTIDEVAPLLFMAMSDDNEDVAAAALASWAAHAPGRPWVRDLVVAACKVNEWSAPERGMKIMAQMGDPAFLPHIAPFLAETDNHGKVEGAIAAITRIAEAHPECGVVVLDVREPWKVRERFALPYEELRHDAEAHSEALRLTMLGLVKRTRAADVAAKAGQRVMLTPLSGDLPTESARVPSDQVEGLLMHLAVVFADEESGSIIAEVTAEPSGDVLTALLQSKPVAAAVVSWT